MTRTTRRYGRDMPIGRRAEHEVHAIPHLPELDAYIGKWVAVKGGRVVASAATSEALARELRTRHLQGAVMQFVPSQAHTFVVGVG